MFEIKTDPAKIEAGRATVVALTIRNASGSWYSNLSFDAVSDGNLAIIKGDPFIRNITLPPNSAKVVELTFLAARPGAAGLDIGNISYRCDGVPRRDFQQRKLEIEVVPAIGVSSRAEPPKAPRRQGGDGMRVKGEKLQFIVEMLTDRFSPGELRRLVAFNLDTEYDVIVSDGAKRPDAALEIAEYANRRNLLPRLLRGARALNPEIPDLSNFFVAMGAGPVASAANLERIVAKSTKFQDPVAFRSRLSRIELWVCRIEHPNGGGTGFLVGPDLVLTNQHVVDDVIGRAVAPQDVRLSFDFKRLQDGTDLLAGAVVGLAEQDWLIDCSPPSAADSGTPGAVVARDELDYALVRLNRRIGQEALAADGVTRGWLTVPSQPAVVAARTPLLVVQYPGDLRLQLAIGTVLSYEQEGRRIRHDAATIGGSSGSPCFDVNWDLFAIHHAGDPNYDPTHAPQFNQAVPISRIVAMMAERNIEPFWDKVP